MDAKLLVKCIKTTHPQWSDTKIRRFLLTEHGIRKNRFFVRRHTKNAKSLAAPKTERRGRKQLFQKKHSLKKKVRKMLKKKRQTPYTVSRDLKKQM